MRKDIHSKQVPANDREDERASRLSEFPIWNRAELVTNTRSFMFTGPDGVQYRWALGASGMNYPKVHPLCLIGILDAKLRYEVGNHRWEEDSDC